jgi:aspartokinase/homoserine dehydrogenase 1
MSAFSRVLKFGGTSVGSPERLSQVLELVAAERAHGPVAVVVSAMGDTTDWLLEAVELAKRGELMGALELGRRVAGLAEDCTARVVEALGARGLATGAAPDGRALVAPLVAELRTLLEGVAILREGTPQTRDLVMSFGERMSATIVSALLTLRGLPATFVDARGWCLTDDTFGRAVVSTREAEARLASLAATWGERVPVHTGFLGRTADGRTTTLGRNGSDYTAALLASGLGAREVVIWTDVSGVMTADPSLVREAYPVPRLTYFEGIELASLGLKMLHPRTMVPLMAKGIPLCIRNTMRPDDPGTRIDERGGGDVDRPSCVTSLEDMALFDLQAKVHGERIQVGRRATRALGEAGVPVWLETQAPRGSGVAIVTLEADAPRAKAALEAELAAELASGDLDPVRVSGKVTLLTLVAEAMGRTPNVAGRFFSALGNVGVNVLASGQGASSRAVSAVIAADDTPVAVRTVHAAFNLAEERVSLFVVGKGVVGGALMAQLAAQTEVLRRDYGVRLSLVGVADSSRALFDERGLDAAGAHERLAREGVSLEARPLSSWLDELRRLPAPVLVDCTAADDMERLYHEAFRRGVHVVAANKKPLTIETEARDALLRSAAASHRAYRYETTVGAALPIIDTLKNLVRTGDRVHLVEGSMSGTLGYLTSELMRGVPLAEAVRVAKELGYTEPSPQDDLSGLDAARKGLILARELGMKVSMSEVVVEPLVPSALLATRDLSAFFEALAAHEPEMSARVAELSRAGRVLRYLVRIDPGAPPGTPRVRAAPIAVDAEHPAAHLRGTESFVAFTTERYARYPLIVRGAGAGGAVTAAGVLADVLALSQSLRGR